MPSRSCRLFPMLALFAMLASACGSDLRLEPDGEGTGGRGVLEENPSACDGALTTTPRTLATDLGTGELHVAGDVLLLAESDTGRIVSIDRCSGATTVLAELGAPVSIALLGADVVVAVGSAPPAVVRIPLAGGEPTHLAELPGPGKLATHDGRLFAVVALPLDEEDADDQTPDAGVLEIDLASGATTLLHREPLWLPGGWSLLGVSEAGLYVRNSSYHGGNPGLLRVPLGGGDVAELAGTHGALDLAVTADHVVVGGEPEEIGMGGGSMEIARMTLAGGEREVLLPASDDHTGTVLRIGARERAVCWSLLSGTAVRCMAATPDAPVRVLGADDDAGRDRIDDLVMAVDAVYWLRGGADGMDLVGAAL